MIALEREAQKNPSQDPAPTFSDVGLDREWRTARIIWTPKTGPRIPLRGLWATWRDERPCWLCHIAGQGIHPRAFTILRQSEALTFCHLVTWRDRYRIKFTAGLWDGRPDVALIPAPAGSQLDLFGFGAGRESPSSNTGLLSQNETGHIATNRTFVPLFNDLTPKQGGVAFVSKMGAFA